MSVMPLGEASVKIVPDTSGFAAQVTKDINDALSGVGKVAEKTGQDIKNGISNGLKDVAKIAEQTGDDLKEGINGGLKDVEKASEKSGKKLGEDFKDGGKKAEKAVDNLDDKIKTVAKNIAKAFVAAGLIAFTKSTIEAAEGAEQTRKRLDQVATSMGIFGDQVLKVTDRLAKYASTVSRSTGIDDDAIIAAQTKLLVFKSLAETADVVGGSFDRTTQAAIDLSAAGFGSIEGMALRLGKALENPLMGMMGLTKIGVTFTAEQQNVIKALVETNRVAEAQDMILQAVEQRVGGTAAATASASAKMKVAYDELQESIGGALLPTFQALSSAIIPVLDEFGKLDPTVQTVVASMGAAVAMAAGLSSVLENLGMAAATANIAGGVLAAGFMAFSFILQEHQAEAAAAKARQEELTKALEASGDPTTLLDDKLKNLVSTYNSLHPESAVPGVQAMANALDFTRAQIIEFIPNINKAGVSLDDLNGYASTGTDLFQKVAGSLGYLINDSKEYKDVNADISAAINDVIKKGDPLGILLLQLADNSGLNAEEFRKLLIALDETSDAFDDNRNVANENAKGLLTSTDNVRALSGILGEELYSTIVRVAGKTGDWNGALSEVVRRAEAAGYEVNGATGEISGMADATDGATLEAQAYAESLGFVVTESGNVEISQENMGKAIEIAQKRYDDAVKAVDDYKRALEEAYSAARSSIDTGFALVESQQAAAEAIKEYDKAAKSSNTSTAKLDKLAREASKAILDVSDKALADAEIKAKMAGATLDAAAAQDIQVEALKNFRDSLNPSSTLYQYVQGFIDTLEGVPTDIPIELTTEVDTAQRELQGFQKIAKDMGFQIGNQITKGILEALAPLSPEFAALLKQMQFLEGQAMRLAELSLIKVNEPLTLDALGRAGLLSFAQGGIFTEPQVGVFGEAGAEAIIPLTKPGRALELMRESGLLGLAQAATSSGQNFDITVVSAEPMRTAKDVVREFQALEYRMGPL